MSPHYNDDLGQKYPRLVVVGEKTFVMPHVTHQRYNLEYVSFEQSFQGVTAGNQLGKIKKILSAFRIF